MQEDRAMATTIDAPCRCLRIGKRGEPDKLTASDYNKILGEISGAISRNVCWKSGYSIRAKSRNQGQVSRASFIMYNIKRGAGTMTHLAQHSLRCVLRLSSWRSVGQ